MPHFYFDTSCSGGHQNDSEGLAFENDDQARTEALKALGEIAKEETPRGAPNDFRISVRDARGIVVFRASLRLRSDEQSPPANEAEFL
jgi:hypothetical protein